LCHLGTVGTAQHLVAISKKKKTLWGFLIFLSWVLAICCERAAQRQTKSGSGWIFAVAGPRLLPCVVFAGERAGGAGEWRGSHV
jgi:hypothetical protein